MFNIFGTREPPKRRTASGAPTAALADDTLKRLKKHQALDASYNKKIALLEKQVDIAKQKAKAELAAGRRDRGECSGRSVSLKLPALHVSLATGGHVRFRASTEDMFMYFV